ncbi:MAG TPA: NTP transferase domain-containing protein, partial [Nitrospira sp.]|nr:NTP transferase domain-containing protein [Nitrospira sp.]
MNVLAVIPARYASTRFPGKPLTPIAGKPMIQRVWERAQRARLVSKVVVATDDQRIASAVKSLGGDIVLTRADHRSGTERVAEVAASHRDAELVVNVQGDMPVIEPEAIDAAIEAVREDEDVRVGTLATPITNPADI